MHVRDACGAELAAMNTAVDLAGRRVLDLGCGDGRLTRAVIERARNVPQALAAHLARETSSVRLRQVVTLRVLRTR